MTRRHALFTGLLAASALVASADAASATKAAACGQAINLLSRCHTDGAGVSAIAACCVPYRALAALGCACDIDTMSSVQRALSGDAGAGVASACGARAQFGDLVEKCINAAQPAVTESRDFETDPFTALFQGASDWATAAVDAVSAALTSAFEPIGRVDAAALAEALSGGALPIFSTYADDDDEDAFFDFDGDDDIVDVDSPAELLAALDAAGADASFFAPIAANTRRDVIVDVDADNDGTLTTAAVARGPSGGVEAAALDVQYGRGSAGARDTMQRLADWVASLADGEGSSASTTLVDALGDAAGVLEAVGERVAAAVAATPGAADGELAFDVSVDVGPSARDARVDVHVESMDGRVPVAALEAALRAAAADAAASAPAGVTLSSTVDADATPMRDSCVGDGPSRWLCECSDAIAAVLVVEVALIAAALAILTARAVTAPAAALEGVMAEEEALIGTAVQTDEEAAALREPLWAVDTK